MQRPQVIQAYVDEAKEKLVDATTEMDATTDMDQLTLKKPVDWPLIHADGLLKEAKRLLEGENAIEKREVTLKHLVKSWHMVQKARVDITHKLKNPMRDAMSLIAVSISGHQRDGFFEEMESAGLQLDYAMKSQMLRSYHEVFRDVEGAFKQLNRRGKRDRRRRNAINSPRPSPQPSTCMSAIDV